MLSQSEIEDKRRELDERFTSLFKLAGIKYSRTWLLENQYWPKCEDYIDEIITSPWYLFDTEFGLIKIGWRKRVISIDWEGTKLAENNRISGKSFPIPEEDKWITHGEYYVHAYTYEKALQYLIILKNEMKKVQTLITLRSN